MTRKFTLLILLTLAILSLPALADNNYYIQAQLEQVQNINSVPTWGTPVKFTLNLTETYSFYGITVYYHDIGNSNTLADFGITGGNVADTAIAVSQPTCIKGTCASTNGTPNTIGDIRLTLLNIILQSSATTFNGTDSPIYAYLYVNNKELALTRNPITPPMDTFDASKYFTSQDNGWSGSGQTSELDVFFARQSGTQAYISVAGKAGDTVLRTPRSVEDSQKIKFILEDSGIYTFTVKYYRTNFWGYSSEITDIYVLSVAGITSTSTVNVVTADAPYPVTLPNSFSVPMSQAGTFEQTGGVSIQNTGNVYTFTFANPGDYRLKYTATSGGAVTYVRFNVKPALDPTPAATQTVTGNQQQNNDSGGNNNWMFYGAGTIGLIVLVGWMLTRKKSGRTMNIRPD